MNTGQREVFDAAVRGDSFLMTGIAGSGKSFTLQRIVHWARAKGLRFGLTASTGAAAVLIGGQTLHSFAGIGTGAGTPPALVTKVLGRKDVTRRLRDLQLLVVDEISMVDADLFDKLSAVFAACRNNRRPFGGVQLILCGDFCQLPPVQGDFAFLSQTWLKMDLAKYDLTESIRQKDDTFAAILRDVRWGLLTPNARATLAKCEGADHPVGVQPTRLFSTNAAVDQINQAEMDNLLEDGAQWRQYDTEYSHAAAKTWATSGRIPDKVIMAVGSQVMCAANLDIANGLVNGSRGVVEAVEDKVVRVRFLSGTRTIGFHKMVHEESPGTNATFMPLRLAWALSVHKSQGQTLDYAEIDLRRMFSCGQAYVSVSRVKSLEALTIRGLSASAFKCSPLVKEFYGVA